MLTTIFSSQLDFQHLQYIHNMRQEYLISRKCLCMKLVIHNDIFLPSYDVSYAMLSRLNIVEQYLEKTKPLPEVRVI
jgi:hypothetical protein